MTMQSVPLINYLLEHVFWSSCNIKPGWHLQSYPVDVGSQIWSQSWFPVAHISPPETIMWNITMNLWWKKHIKPIATFNGDTYGYQFQDYNTKIGNRNGMIFASREAQGTLDSKTLINWKLHKMFSVSKPLIFIYR